MKKPVKLHHGGSLAGLLLLAGCGNAPEPPGDDSSSTTTPVGTEYDFTHVPAETQRSGDPVAGWNYLVYGDYLAYGIPYDLLTQYTDGDGNLLERTGDSAGLPRSYNAVTSPNGVRIASPNCLACHSQVLNGKLVIGLGNSLIDATIDYAPVYLLLDRTIRETYGAASPEWDAYQPYRDPAVATASYLIAPFKGVHVADKTFLALAAYRDPHSLEWLGEQLFPIPDSVVPSDVPAWWLLRKKHALYYSAAGRGDMARLITAAMLAAIVDAGEAAAIDAHFPDLLAYLLSIEPPPYPGPIDPDRATRGRITFEERCAVCHGTYGEQETYPNLFVSLETVGTDPLLARSNYADPGFEAWYNDGWFGQEPPARPYLDAGDGYIAPPLDGVWATAPYLHNGSVPDLHALLNSPERPTWWRRSFEETDYDLERVGWKYTVEAAWTDKQTYDTTLPGYNNSGHVFGDVLDDQARRDLIEYLKTL